MLCIKFKNYLDGQKPVFEVSHRNKPSRVATVWHLSDRFFIIWTVLAFNSTANRYFYLKSCIGQTAPLGLNRLTILRCLNMTFNSILQKYMFEINLASKNLFGFQNNFEEKCCIFQLSCKQSLYEWFMNISRKLKSLLWVAPQEALLKKTLQ